MAAVAAIAAPIVAQPRPIAGLQPISAGHYAAYIVANGVGTDVRECVAIVARLARGGHYRVLLICLSAAIAPRRAVVTLPGDDPLALRASCPEVLIGLRPGVPDGYKYKQLHVMGQIICHFASGHNHEKKFDSLILSNHGDAIFGSVVKQSKAGVINKATADAWVPSDLAWVRENISAQAYADVKRVAQALIGVIPSMSDLAKTWAGGQDVDFVGDNTRVTGVVNAARGIPRPAGAGAAAVAPA